jgi:5-methylcytosine-specific restriction endonuclease McrA
MTFGKVQTYRLADLVLEPSELHPPVFPAGDFVPERERGWGFRQGHARRVWRAHRLEKFFRLRQSVYDKTQACCWYCGSAQGIGRKRLTMDHVVPRRHGGLLELTNLVSACQDCNERKGTSSLEDFLDAEAKRQTG